MKLLIYFGLGALFEDPSARGVDDDEKAKMAKAVLAPSAVFFKNFLIS